MTNIESFDAINGKPTHKLTVTNKNGVALTCLDFAALWYGLELPTKTGPRNVILNMPHANDYVNASSYLGKSIGRTAGRIPKGQAKIGQQMVQLPINEGKNNLHGGANGFHSVIWDGIIDRQSIIFTHHFNAKDDGYPGNLDAKITYRLNDQNEVTIAYEATSDADTLFNPTSHAYFNLNGDDEDVGALNLYLNSKDRLALDAEKLPDGKRVPLQGTPYNFDPAASLAKTFDVLKDTEENGIDDVYVIPAHDKDQPVATLTQPKDDVSVSLFSPRNGLVLYTGNCFGPDYTFVGRSGKVHQGVALEAQTLPTAVFDSRDGDIRLQAGISKLYETRYAFKF